MPVGGSACDVADGGAALLLVQVRRRLGEQRAGGDAARGTGGELHAPVVEPGRHPGLVRVQQRGVRENPELAREIENKVRDSLGIPLLPADVEAE